MRQLRHLARSLPPTVAWLVVEVPDSRLLTIELATALAVTRRTLRVTGRRLVVRTPALPSSYGARARIGERRAWKYR